MSENRRNVDALVRLLREAPTERGTATVAEFLASRGVLVPSVLTDEDCRDLPAYYPETSIEEPEKVWADLRSGLECIAKGGEFDGG